MLDVFRVPPDACVTAKTCDLVHTGFGAYGVVLLAVGILLLGLVLLALTWRGRPSVAAFHMADTVHTVHTARMSEEPESDAGNAYLAGDA